jgi:hypothetical protein
VPRPLNRCPSSVSNPVRFAGFFDKLASVDTKGGGGGSAAGDAKATESVAVQAEEGEVDKEVGVPLDAPQPFEPQGVLCSHPRRRRIAAASSGSDPLSAQSLPWASRRV